MKLTVYSCLLLALGVSLPAAGGVVLRQVEVKEGGDEEAIGRQVAQMWMEGEKSKILFEESPNPMIPRGSYLLAPGGDFLYLVNPAQKTVARMDTYEMQAMGEQAGQFAERQAETTGQRTEVVDLKLELKLDEPGPQMLGMPTRHYRYELSYTEKQDVRGMPGGFRTRVHEEHEFWATDALKDEPAISAMRAEQLADPAADDVQREVQEAEARMYAHGFFLKHIIERKASSGMGGPMGGMMGMMTGMNESEEERISREVTELRRATLSATEFELPQGYAETELFTPQGGGMPDLNSLPGMGEPDGGAMPDLDSLPGMGEPAEDDMPDLDAMPR